MGSLYGFELAHWDHERSTLNVQRPTFRRAFRPKLEVERWMLDVRFLESLHIQRVNVHCDPEPAVWSPGFSRPAVRTPWRQRILRPPKGGTPNPRFMDSQFELPALELRGGGRRQPLRAVREGLTNDLCHLCHLVDPHEGVHLREQSGQFVAKALGQTT